MNHKLRNLDEKMNETVLKDIRFEDKHKQHILKTVKKSTIQESKRPHLKSRFNAILSASVTCALLFGMIYFAGGQMGFLNEEENPAEQISPIKEKNTGNTGFKEIEVQENEEHRNKYLGHDLPYSSYYSEKYPDQLKIVEKMYYSWDYIDNAQGEYETGHPGDGEVHHTRFYVDFNNKKNYTEIQITKNGKLVETSKVLFQDDVAIHKLREENVYTKRLIKDNLKTYRDEAYEDEMHYLGGGKLVTNSEWFLLLKNNYENWHYKETEKFGMPVYQIEGETPRHESSPEPFSMIVSKETGALLDLKIYDSNKNIKYYVKVNKVKLNHGISKNVFNLDLSGSKEVTWDEYIPLTYGAKAFKGEKTGWDHQNGK